jgi:asparagine synthase (glutamine-hydrolysing)
MCGFLGYVSKKSVSETHFRDALQLMAHRGPDYHSTIKDKIADFNIGLGHTRLSIIDLSEHAAQPFESSCRRYVLAFNGEIYNYRELKSELTELGYSFRTHSDTEVLINALSAWGLNVLSRLIGMFAFVLLDRKDKKIFLVRDAFGIKPFFYILQQDKLLFASELKSLLNIYNGKIKPNLQRAYEYLVHGVYDSSADTFVEGVNHLPPAHYLTFNLKNGEASEPIRWWQPSIAKSYELSFGQAKEKLRDLFLESVKLQLRSDVPLGIALSGGIDSSAVASAVRYLEPEMPLHTFSYVASEALISEEKWIDKLNQSMQAVEHKVLASEREMQADLDDMVLKQGEPFGSTSIYAQYRVFKLARDHGVTVTLDGQGADELLAGYFGYPGHRLLSLIESEGLLSAHAYAKRWANSPDRSYPMAWKYLLRIKLPDFLYALVRKRMGRDFQPLWLDTQYLAEEGVRFMESRAPLAKENRGKRVKEALANALVGRGLPALLRHGDRNSMAFSIESRVPFLTLPLAEFLLSLPENYLISNEGVTKHVFREAMRGIVPDSHLDRKDKIGFATPESTWLIRMGGVIKNWIEQAPDIVFIKKSEVLMELSQVLDGKRPFDNRVWRWVNYLRWYSLMEVQ